MTQDSSLLEQLVPARRAAQRAMARCKEQQSSRSSKHESAPSATPATPATPSRRRVDAADDDESSLTPDESPDNGHSTSKSIAPTSKATRGKSSTMSKPLRRVKSQSALTRDVAISSQASRFLSPLSDSSAETLPRPVNKRKVNKGNATSSRKRPKLEPTQSESRIQDLLIPTIGGGDFVSFTSDTWSQDKLGEIVFVRLGSEGTITPFEETLLKPPGYWWPAKCLGEAEGELKVRLYGDDGHGTSREVLIPEPSHRCITSWKDTNSGASFIQGEFTGVIEPRLLKNQYWIARHALQGDIGLHKVESPSEEAPSRSQAPPRGRGRSLTLSALPLGGRKKIEDLRDLGEGPDATLMIPGELVLAREPKGKHIQYWPARILEFSPKDPDDEKDFPGYIVQFFPAPDDPQKIRRSFFATTVEDEFLTCKAGEWQTEFAENHLPRDDNAPSRSPTPEVEVTAHPGKPPPPEEFRDLTIKEQLQFAQLILSLIIQGRYIPAVQDHLAFLNGGTDRTKVISMAGQDGGFSTGEIENIRYEVMRWALRDERRSQHFLLDGDDRQPTVGEQSQQLGTEGAPTGKPTEVPVAENSAEAPTVPRRHPPRPKGDDLYEEMSREERIHYCTDFLCRQALIQLLMWRHGIRKTINQQNPEDERTAYDKAADKLAEGHWWNEVVDRRKALLRKKREREQSASDDLDRRGRRRR